MMNLLERIAEDVAQVLWIAVKVFHFFAWLCFVALAFIFFAVPMHAWLFARRSMTNGFIEELEILYEDIMNEED